MAKSYAFKVGEIECSVLLDGASLLTLERFMGRFPDGTEEDYRQAFAEIGLKLEEASSSMNILLAKIGDETILVDTGEGQDDTRPGGALLESMKLAGISPDDITLVVITHSHGDHVLGLLTAEGEPTFPNATYVISIEEMAFWQGRIERGLLDQQAIIDMMKSKGLRHIEMDAEIMPGLRALPLPGHTPGQIGLQFESGSERLLHLADLLHSPMQFTHPEWSPKFDADTNQSVPTRREALGKAADGDSLVMFYHLTFPGLGRVRRRDMAFIWMPLETDA